MLAVEDLMQSTEEMDILERPSGLFETILSSNDSPVTLINYIITISMISKQ